LGVFYGTHFLFFKSSRLRDLQYYIELEQLEQYQHPGNMKFTHFCSKLKCVLLLFFICFWPYKINNFTSSSSVHVHLVLSKQTFMFLFKRNNLAVI